MDTKFHNCWPVRHSATRPDGSTVRRISIHRHYTHVVFIPDAHGGWADVSWHESLEQAEDAVSGLRRHAPEKAQQARIEQVSTVQQLTISHAA